MSGTQRVAVTPQVASAAPVLRRKCGCGATASPKAETCPACAEKKLQPKLVVGGAHAPEEREADRVADTVMNGGQATVGAAAPAVRREATGSARGEQAAPASVGRVLGRAGQPLDAGARGFFEQRFGRDFSQVRIHADSEAAASARAVDAHAYTVGERIVFGAARYAPDTAAGRRLLAHELTHVVQQGATLRRESTAADYVGSGEVGSAERDEEEEQPVQRLQRHVAIEGSDEAGPKADLTHSEAEDAFRLAERDKRLAEQLAECKKNAAPDPEICDPMTPPDWSQFTGPAPGGAFDAVTFSQIVAQDVPSQKCEQDVKGAASGPLKRFQGVFTPAKSGAKQKVLNATDPTKNGSAAQVATCEANFPPGTTGGWWALSTTVTGCAASPAPRGDRATKKADCATIVAKDFNDAAAAESMRLLNHEQVHLKLTCAMAKKGNDAMAAGKTFAEVDAVIHAKLAAAQSLYDGQSHHGCTASSQATWEGEIAKGLPQIVLFAP